MEFTLIKALVIQFTRFTSCLFSIQIVGQFIISFIHMIDPYNMFLLLDVRNNLNKTSVAWFVPFYCTITEFTMYFEWPTSINCAVLSGHVCLLPLKPSWYSIIFWLKTTTLAEEWDTRCDCKYPLSSTDAITSRTTHPILTCIYPVLTRIVLEFHCRLSSVVENMKPDIS